MSFIKAHFDGTTVVFDEPLPFPLIVGQTLRVMVEPVSLEDKNLDDMTDDELAEWLEVETHRLRGVQYNHHSADGR